MCGVRERINALGNVDIPLYEDDVVPALETLLQNSDPSVEGLVVCLLYSYKNPDHENRVAELAQAWMAENGIDIPIYLSSDLYPLRGDLMRFNTLIIDAYAGAPSRHVLQDVNRRVGENGCAAQLDVEAAPPEYPVLFRFKPDLETFYNDWLGRPLPEG
mgnify:FL=1